MPDDESAREQGAAPRDLRRLLVPVLVAVTLLAVVAATAGALRSRSLDSDELGGDLGIGLLNARWSQNLVVAILAVAALGAAVAGIWMVRIRTGRGSGDDVEEDEEVAPAPWWKRALAVVTPLVLMGLVVAALARGEDAPPPPPPPGGPVPGEEVDPSDEAPPVDWWFVGAAVVAAAAAGVVLARRWSPVVAPQRRPRGPVAVAVRAAVDDSLDALLAEPDHRRAVVAAYARMEQVLAHAELARAPWEAPVEYLVRVMFEAGVRAETAGTLTDLFERARFSPHPVDAAMRQAAIDALVALRDELAAAGDRDDVGAEVDR